MCIFFVKCTCCHCRGWVGCASSKENREKKTVFMVRLTIGVPSLTKSTWENFGPIFPFFMRRYRTRVREGAMTMTNTFREHLQRAIFETFEL